MKCACIILLCLLTVGCLQSVKSPTMSEKMDTWLGFHISEAIQQWGVYQYTASDGKGGTIYTWEETSQSHTYMPLRTYPFVLGATDTNVYRRSLYVRPDGIIYRWHTKGY